MPVWPYLLCWYLSLSRLNSSLIQIWLCMLDLNTMRLSKRLKVSNLLVLGNGFLKNSLLIHNGASESCFTTTHHWNLCSIQGLRNRKAYITDLLRYLALNCLLPRVGMNGLAILWTHWIQNNNSWNKFSSCRTISFQFYTPQWQYHPGGSFYLGLVLQDLLSLL